MDVRAALRRARQVIALVMNPAMLAGVGDGGRRDGQDGRLSAALSRFDWIGPDGVPDAGLLGASREAVELLLTDRAVLHVGRVADLPVEAAARRALAESVVRLVFERLGTSRPVSEGVLTAALSMLVTDAATVRRDAVDAAVLVRTADGSSYRLRDD